MVPDFTLSKVENVLTITMEDKMEMTFPLVVLIPHNKVASCFAVQPHPLWEQKLATISVPIWLVVFVFITALALVQTNFGIPCPSCDTSLPPVQPTGGSHFNFADLPINMHNSILEKLDTLERRCGMSVFCECVCVCCAMYVYVCVLHMHMLIP